MAETNPLFQASAALAVDTPSAFWPAGESTNQLESEIEIASRIVMQTVSASSSAAATLRDEPEMFLLEVEPSTAYSTKALMKALLIVGESDADHYITQDESTPWQPVRYQSRQMTTSEATAFSNIEAPRNVAGPRLIKHLSRYLRSIFRPTYGAALADRIEALSAMVREESDGSLTLSGASLASLIAFLEGNAKLSAPKLVAGPGGEVIGVWKRPGQAEFVSRFMPNGTVRYLLTTPNPKHPQGTSRISGDTTPDKVVTEGRLAEFED